METNPRFAGWQVKQAADAILLYADKYLKPKPSLLPSNGSMNQSPWDRTTDETRLTGKKYSTNCMKACIFDIIRPGRKNPTGSGSTSSGNISTIANLGHKKGRMSKNF